MSMSIYTIVYQQINAILRRNEAQGFIDIVMKFQRLGTKNYNTTLKFKQQ